MAKIKSGGKAIIGLIVVAIVLASKFFYFDKVPSSVDQSETIKIGVVTWPGYVAGQLMNGGFQPNTDCRFFKEYGITVDFKVIDDFVASRKAFENGEIDLLWTTVDALPTELGTGSTLLAYNPKFIFQADWSRGGDAIVVTYGIKTVADLRNKSVAVAQGTPSHSFLINLLNTNSMTIDDIKMEFVPSAIDAANMFKQGAVDAAVVWSPDDVDCIDKVTRASILASTKEATHIIADGFIAKEEYINNNLDKLQKLYDGWMVGAMELNLNKDSSRIKASSILAEQFQMREADALSSLENVRFATHGDNVNFFDFGDKNAVTADFLYTKMSKIYQDINMVQNPATWREISFSGLVKSSKLTGVSHRAEPIKSFETTTKEDETVQEFSNKKITINFPNAGFVLNDDSKYTIEKEFLDILKTYQSARIRIEGNTDATGNHQKNISLSKKRAESVKDYLIIKFNVDPNRIITIGNGSKHADSDGVKTSNEKYRSTDFMLIK